MIPIEPREWRLKINGVDVSFEELINRLTDAGFNVNGSPKQTQCDKTTEEVIAERFDGIDEKIRKLENPDLGVYSNHSRRLTEIEQKIEALGVKVAQAFRNDVEHVKWHDETKFGPRIHALEERSKQLDEKIEKNGISDDSLKLWARTTDRLDYRLKQLEETELETIHWTKPECEKLTQQLTVIEGKQAATEMAATRLEKRVAALDDAFATHTVSQRAFVQLQEHVDLTQNMHNERLKRLEVGVFPNAEQSLPRRFEELKKTFIHSGQWSREVDKRLQTLEAKEKNDAVRESAVRIQQEIAAKEKEGWMPNPEPVRFNNEGRGIEVIVHDVPDHFSTNGGIPTIVLIDRILNLAPSRVLVDVGGPGRTLLDEMRRNGLPAEPLPKRPRVVDHAVAEYVGPKNKNRL